MFVFGVIAGSGFLVLILAAVLGRPLLSRSVKLRLVTSPHGAVCAGVRSCLRVLNRALATLAALVCFAMFVGVGVVRAHAQSDPANSSYALAAWIVAAVVLGAVSSTAATHLCAHAMTRSTPRIDDSTRAGPSDTLREGILGAGAATLAFSAILLLSLTGLAMATFGFSAGFEQPGTAAARNMVMLTTAYALGTVLASLISHVIGGVFVSAAAPLPHAPASLGARVGMHLSVSTSRAADLYASIATGIVATSIVFFNAAPTATSVQMALCPLLAVAFSVLSCTVGLSVVRTDGAEPVPIAIDRGLGVTLVLCAASFVGLTHWLFSDGWWRLVLAAVSGLLGATLVVGLERAFATRGSSVSIDRWMTSGAFGLQRASLLGAVAVSASLGGFVAGRSTGLEGGGSLGLAFVALGMLAPAPFVLTTSALAATIHRQLSLGYEMGDARSQCRLVPVARFNAANGYTAVCSALVAWIAVPAFSFLAGIVGTKAEAIVMDGLHVGIVAASALVGTLLVFWTAGAALRAVAAVVELQRQSGADATKDSPTVPASLSVTMLLTNSVHHGIPVTFLMVFVPGSIWGLAWAVWGGQHPYVAMVATGALVLGASSAGLSLSLAAENIGNCWQNWLSADATRASSDKSVDVAGKWEKNRGDGAAVVGDTLGSSLQSLVGSCIHTLVKLLATAALALAPLFF